MKGILIRQLVDIVSTIIITLVGVLGTWLSVKLAKMAELETINEAQKELFAAAQKTVGELQQTIVEDLKAAHADGKLTEDEILMLGTKLIEMTLEKMSESAQKVLEAAGANVVALIKGAGEDWINSLKN